VEEFLMNPGAVSFAPHGRLSAEPDTIDPTNKFKGKPYDHSAGGARKYREKSRPVDLSPRQKQQIPRGNDGVHLLNFQYPKTPLQKIERPRNRKYQDTKPPARRTNSTHNSLFSR
jgi:hypothetical protein